MTLLPASDGWHWFKQGFALYRKQPGALTTLFMGTIFLLLAMALVPLLGTVVTPILIAAFSQACVDVEQDRPVLPSVLLAGFRTPAAKPLFRLGLLYAIVALAVIGLIMLIDDGMLAKVMTQKVELGSKEIADSRIMWTLLFIIVANAFMSVTLFFSASLVHLKQMKVGKAIFYSFFGMLGAIRAFLLFALVWTGLVMFIAMLIGATIGASQVGVGLMFTASLICTVIAACSLYASYCRIFGAPEPAVPAKTL
jgi:MFS family permease